MMGNTRVDPRVIRTRRLLMDAFVRLTHRKDFQLITIQDITDEATVNRATFYSHFNDKYHLMEVALTEDIVCNIVESINEFDQVNKETIAKIFLALTKFHTETLEKLSIQCRRSYESFSSLIEHKIKEELETKLHTLLLKQHPDQDSELLRIGAAVLSWGIYGASVDWKQNGKIPAEEYYKMAAPFILYGS